MMAIRGTVADRSGVRRSTVPSAGGAGGAALITYMRCQVRVWRRLFADALPGRV